MASSGHPLTPSDVLKGRSPSSPFTQKGVVLVDEPDEIIPPPVYDDDDPTESSSTRRHKANISGKKLTGRPPLPTKESSSSIARKNSGINLSNSDFFDSSSLESSQSDAKRILTQVADWLNEEKAKASSKKSTRKKKKHHHAVQQSDPDDTPVDESGPDPPEEGIDLSTLESILAGYMKSSTGSTPNLLPKSSPRIFGRKGSIAQKFKRQSLPPQSSDTEFFGDDILVPNVQADLDNSKTLAYSGGAADEDNEKIKKKDQKAWNTFKKDILRLTHTLKLKGWRRIPMENGPDLEVSRLSGALTNAVYVVRAAKPISKERTDDASTTTSKPRPMQLLLRIYGPQVEHLINREDELAILKRLARKRIGPRMLGTFSNGRFEEYLNAKTLEAQDLRVPETSKQIAKRMRELHDGIDLLDSEVDAGPAIFLNWDKWVDRCEKVIKWLDQQVHQAESGTEPKPKAEYTRLGLICGVEWPVFRKIYDKYRRKLVEECGGEVGLKKKLVFAHNDTQYGNLMRLIPDGESPLLKAVNQHKQLVVIDFEYAGQNTTGLEFANHFTEWTYNYHHPEKPWACNHKSYPTPEEQHRFVRSYVMHRPQFNPAASATPMMEAREKTNISDFMLDARAPPETPAGDYDVEEQEREKAMEKDIQRLLHETRLWRIANSAQWVAWGIVQAKVPELDDKKSVASAVKDKVKKALHPHSDPLHEEDKEHQEDARHDRPEGREQEEAHSEGDDEQDEEFDYLAYAQERAMFFWGDCLQMNLIKEDELPEQMREKVKFVRH